MINEPANRPSNVIDYNNLPPMMVQYWDIKNTYPDYLILFRVGDFFELFYDDAKLVSSELGLTLTKKCYGKKSTAKTQENTDETDDGKQEIPMCGMPHTIHMQYCCKLVMLNYKIVVCDQMETPEQAKIAGRSVVQRQITKILTKSTIFYENENLDLDNHFLVTIVAIENKQYNILICDISTNDYYYKDCGENELASFIRKIKPEEILISKHDIHRDKISEILIEWRDKLIFWTPKIDTELPKPWKIYLEKCSKEIISNTYTMVSYLINHGITISPQGCPEPFPFKEYISLDSKTIRNLHLVDDNYGIDRRNKIQSVLGCLDNTATPMGKRYLRNVLLFPSTNLSVIQDRQNKVSFFMNLLNNQGDLDLSGIGDIEKSLSQCMRRRISPIVLVKMAKDLKKITNILSILKRTNYPEELNYQCYAADLILNTMEDEEHIANNIIIRASHVPILQEYRHKIYHIEQNLKQLIAQYNKDYGISNIKIKKDQRSEDFMEVPKSQEKAVAAINEFKIIQSNITSIKFVSSRFNSLCKEKNLINEQIDEVTQSIINQLIDKVEESFTEIQQIIRKIAEIDLYISFARVGIIHKYTMPVVDNSNILDIKKGRHIIASRHIHNFVPNNLNMDGEHFFHIITGPNMGGKSTFLRQNAIIVILSQIGCLVPAEKAHIGIVDNIFTRIGAGDDLIGGQSTFMMEMQEMSDMIKLGTNKSLMIIDELGRGTSVKDGYALAVSVIQYICQKIHCRCIFSTHFHGITKILSNINTIKFFHVGYILRESELDNKKLIFTYSIQPDICNESFGIHVAQMAGLPKELIETAKLLASQT